VLHGRDDMKLITFLQFAILTMLGFMTDLLILLGTRMTY
jgi:hypothetical protein